MRISASAVRAPVMPQANASRDRRRSGVGTYGGLTRAEILIQQLAVDVVAADVDSSLDGR
jgi:hypothetical protein